MFTGVRFGGGAGPWEVMFLCDFLAVQVGRASVAFLEGGLFYRLLFFLAWVLSFLAPRPFSCLDRVEGWCFVAGCFSAVCVSFASWVLLLDLSFRICFWAGRGGPFCCLYFVIGWVLCFGAVALGACLVVGGVLLFLTVKFTAKVLSYSRRALRGASDLPRACAVDRRELLSGVGNN